MKQQVAGSAAFSGAEQTEVAADIAPGRRSPMKKFLIRFFAFLILFFAINSGFACYFNDGLTVNKRNKFHWVCGLSGQSYDIAYVGSSRVEMTVDPVVIDHVLGTNSVNIGVSGGGAGDQYLLTTQLLRHNSVRMVLYQIDYLTLADKFSYPFKEYIWLSYDSDPAVKQAIIDHRGYARYLAWKAVPFVKFMEFASQFELFPYADSGHYWVQRKGGQQRDAPIVSTKKDEFAVYAPNNLATQYVEKTIDLCRENQVKLILFQAPLRSSLGEVSQFPECTAAIQDLVNDYHLEYWDYSSLFHDQTDLFYDNHHLNSEGVRQFSKILSERIREHQSVSSPSGSRMAL